MDGYAIRDVVVATSLVLASGHPGDRRDARCRYRDRDGDSGSRNDPVVGRWSLAPCRRSPDDLAGRARGTRALAPCQGRHDRKGDPGSRVPREDRGDHDPAGAGDM